MEELKKSLRKSGLFTVIVNGFLLVVSISIMVMGFVMWHNITQEADSSNGATALAMIFVLIIVLALVILLEGIAIVFLIMNAVAFSFGMYLLVSKDFDVEKIIKKRRLLITICVLMYAMSVALLLSGIIMLTNGGGIGVGIMSLVVAATLFVVGFFQMKNVKSIKAAIKNIKAQEVQE